MYGLLRLFRCNEDDIIIVSEFSFQNNQFNNYTYYRWRKEYGGMRVDQAHRLKELEQENSRLKRLVTDFSLDNSILKEAAQGNS